MRLSKSILTAIIFWWVYMVVSSCSMSAKNNVTSDTNIGDTALEQPRLQLPEVPRNLGSTKERAAFLLYHYWNKMNWSDTSLIANDFFMEQNMSTYFDLFNHVEPSKILPAVENMIKQASVNPDAIEKICTISDIYLYDTQSPMMNEGYYKTIIVALLKSKQTSDYRTIILQAALDDISKNSVGQPASSFPVITRDGKKAELKKLFNQSGRTILFFYDPDCDDCAMAESLMQSNAAINSAISSGTLKIIAVCPFSVDNTDWKRHAATLPDNWTVGYSPKGQADEDGIYVFRSYPTIYLIDNKGIVMSKDITYETLRELI